MEGRIIAIRVSEAEFAALEALKKEKKWNWNQLLLWPAGVAYGLEDQLPSAAVKVEVVKAEPATKVKKGKKAKAAKVKDDPPRTKEQVLAGEFPPVDEWSEADPTPEQ